MSTSTAELDDESTATETPASVTEPRRRLSNNVLVDVLIVVAVVVFWIVSTSWRPWDLFDRAGFSSDFYDEQARSLLRGRLAVDPEVAGPEGFLVDGKTFLYYGPFLAVVRMPLMLFGDLFVARLVRISMLIALVVLGRWSARLARAGGRLVAPDAGSGTGRHAIGAFVAAMLFSPALFAAGWVSVYHETELWALTLAVIALTLILEWGARGFDDRTRLLWSCAATLAATMTRAPIGLGVAFGLGLCGLWLVLRERRSSPGAIAVAGGVVPLLVHALVNRAKFGTWLSVPGDRQVLSLVDADRATWFAENGGSFFNVGFLPTTVIQYLRPDTIRFERLVPGIRYGPLAENYGSADVETVTPASSLLVSCTLLALLAVVGLWWLIRRGARLWLLMVGAAIVGAAPTFLIGFVANRYLIDMMPPLAVAGAAGTWGIARWPRRTVVVGLVALLGIWGIWVNASLATWAVELKSAGFTELRSDIDHRIFGGGAVDVVDLDPSDVPRDGVVGLTADCGGVYIAEQGRWVDLDRGSGRGAVAGVAAEPAVGDAVVLAQGSTWSVVLRSGDERATVVFDAPVEVDDFSISLPDRDEHAYRVVADPITGEAIVTVADQTVLLPRSVLDAGGLDTGAATSELCVELASRR